MKKILSILLVSVCVLATSLFTTGCITAANPTGVVAVGGQNIDPVAAGTAVRIAAKLGAMAEIQHDPTTRQYFLLSGNAVLAAVAAGNYNPTNIEATLTGVTGDETVAMAIADSLSLYSAFFGNVTAAGLTNKSPYTVPVLTGLANGLNDAVALTVPKPTQ